MLRCGVARPGPQTPALRSAGPTAVARLAPFHTRWRRERRPIGGIVIASSRARVGNGVVSPIGNAGRLYSVQSTTLERLVGQVHHGLARSNLRSSSACGGPRLCPFVATDLAAHDRLGRQRCGPRGSADPSPVVEVQVRGTAWLGAGERPRHRRCARPADAAGGVAGGAPACAASRSARQAASTDRPPGPLSGRFDRWRRSSPPVPAGAVSPETWRTRIVGGGAGARGRRRRVIVRGIEKSRITLIVYKRWLRRASGWPGPGTTVGAVSSDGTVSLHRCRSGGGVGSERRGARERVPAAGGACRSRASVLRRRHRRAIRALAPGPRCLEMRGKARARRLASAVCPVHSPADTRYTNRRRSQRRARSVGRGGRPAGGVRSGAAAAAARARRASAAGLPVGRSVTTSWRQRRHAPRPQLREHPDAIARVGRCRAGSRVARTDWPGSGLAHTHSPCSTGCIGELDRNAPPSPTGRIVKVARRSVDSSQKHESDELADVGAAGSTRAPTFAVTATHPSVLILE